MQKIFTGKIDGKEIETGDIVLIYVPSEKLIEINLQVLRWAVSERGYGAVYVTVNKPFSELAEKFKEAKIETDKIFIIDAITPVKFLDGDNRAENAVFVGSPKELTNISITTTSAIQKFKKAKMLIFDSISTLLFYNDFETVRHFIQFISNKMKELKVTFAMICVKDKINKTLISQLSSFVDKVIEIE